jgi:polysaccharide export outer membrane protein
MMVFRLPQRCVSLALLVAVAAGCATPPPLPADPGVMEREEYVIGASDILAVRVWKQPELSVEQVPVRPDGKISTPLAGDVQAAGLTAKQLQDVLTKALAEYVTAPHVTVIVLKMVSRHVSVEGQVQRPGLLPLESDMRVVDAITDSGGFTPFANRRRIKILRRLPDGSVATYGFNYDAFVAGKAPGSNGLLEPSDTVVVPD